MTTETISLDDGKYTVIFAFGDAPFRFEALRYGDKWRDLCGDKLVLAMFNRIQELESALQGTVDFLTHAPLETGICCCGDSMSQHGNPMDCGHSPVDSGGYAVSSHIDGLRKILPPKAAEAQG
ncbi:hypothetical protein [Comamonas sp.]|uniref:hypothetical protein n=1 Tax=Comamonas sp. TaxID=34028 RepID=UPI0028A84784|nr:hypothetical protein [Comamonas sp.]